MRLLMVAPGVPSATGKGYQVRLYHQIMGLGARHEITLISFGRDDQPGPELREACRRIVLIPWSLPAAAAKGFVAATRLPFSVGLYGDRKMMDAIRREAVTCDLVQLQLVRMAPYQSTASGHPVVLDLLDAAELNMRERARAANLGLRQVMELEARRLGAYEREAIATARIALLISRRDIDYLGNPSNARVLANGIDPQDPKSRLERRPSTIVFSGTMSYFPNADAAVWFAREILPLVRRSIPEATFTVVGREPTAAVRRLAELPGVTVAGEVAEIADEIARAALSVCPMRYGSGMQTKILEAMAVGTPVVATAKALEGIPEDLHRYLHRADSPEEFATETARLMRQPQPALSLAEQGLAAIEQSHTWKHHVADLERAYDDAVRSEPTGLRGQ